MAEQQREVEGWRGSGESAARYAARRGYSSASLLRWAKSSALAGKSPAPEFVRMEVALRRATPLVVEVGRARIVIERGFDVPVRRSAPSGVVDARAAA